MDGKGRAPAVEVMVATAYIKDCIINPDKTRLIHDAMSGDQTLFTNSHGIERLWEVSHPVLERPPVVEPYRPGSWGPPSMDALVAPRTWRLPFARTWRDPR